MIDFGFSELAASDVLLATDVAELLSATSLQVGVDRAVAAAERIVGAEATTSALLRLQPWALSGATRTALKARPGHLDELPRPGPRGGPGRPVVGVRGGRYPPGVSTERTAATHESFGYFGSIGAQLSTIVTIASGVAYVIGVLVTDSYWRRLGTERRPSGCRPPTASRRRA